MTFDAVFDLDGTLIDSVVVCTEIINGMLADRGSHRRVSAKEARRHISLGGAPMMAALMQEDCADSEAEIREFRARYAELDTPLNSVFPAVREGLAMMAAQGVRLSVCSAKPQNLCEKVLDDVGLYDYFAAIAGRASNRPCKPDRAHYDYVLERMGGRHDRSCLIGDGEPDHLLAANAGVPFILVTWGYAEESFDPRDALFADDFDLIPHLVAHLRSGDGLAARAAQNLRRIAS